MKFICEYQEKDGGIIVINIQSNRISEKRLNVIQNVFINVLTGNGWCQFISFPCRRRLILVLLEIPATHEWRSATNVLVTKLLEQGVRPAIDDAELISKLDELTNTKDDEMHFIYGCSKKDDEITINMDKNWLSKRKIDLVNKAIFDTSSEIADWCSEIKRRFNNKPIVRLVLLRTPTTDEWRSAIMRFASIVTDSKEIPVILDEELVAELKERENEHKEITNKNIITPLTEELPNGVFKALANEYERSIENVLARQLFLRKRRCFLEKVENECKKLKEGLEKEQQKLREIAVYLDRNFVELDTNDEPPGPEWVKRATERGVL